MRILGLDLGERRIGVALSDQLHIIAQSLTTIDRNAQPGDIETIIRLVKEHEVEKIIVGLPKNMDGSLGKSAQYAIEFGNVLKEKGLNVEFIDERLTTVQAHSVLLEADLSRKKRGGIVDRLAAQLILQGYLDRKNV